MGLSFLKELDDGQKVRAEVINKLNDMDSTNHQNIKFILKLGDGEVEELISYVELSDAISELIDDEEANPDCPFIYKGIVGHKGPLHAKDNEYKGSKFNVKVQWEDGSVTWEPLSIMAKDDPITCAVYAKDNNLLETDGWKTLRKYARRATKLARQVKQAKARQRKYGPVYKFGVQVPKDWKEARKLQAEFGHTKWTDAEVIEKDQVDDYETFHDLGKNAEPPPGYKKIRVHFVYDVKHDLRYKARLVADGHLTEPDNEQVYAGVVSLKSMRTAILIGEMNGFETMVGDIGNAYLEARTKEKVYFIAGPEFGELQGHVMIIVKAFYGLRTSGARFHEKLSDNLHELGFKPTLADPDLWYRENEIAYDYLCVYVDDLCFIGIGAAEFYKVLKERFGYKLKGVGPIEYHLGGNFSCDKDSTLTWGSSTYIKKILDNYQREFGSLPSKKPSTPLTTGDHPELDDTSFLDDKGIKLYQSMIGALQWCITLGRFDIMYAVMVLSRFRAQPRVGHLDRAKRIYGYLRGHTKAKIRFRTGIPDNEAHFSMEDYSWMHSVYGEKAEDFIEGLPVPRGQNVRITVFEDSSLGACKVTGKSLSGVLLMVNQTPIDWYAKMQSTVESATYGAEFNSAKTATDMIVDIQFTLRSMGVPVEQQAWMLGDNKSVLTSSTIPHSTLKKRHNALSYHRVRSSIAHGVLKFCYVESAENVSDFLTKALGHKPYWHLVRPLLFWGGDTQEASLVTKGSDKQVGFSQPTNGGSRGPGPG